MKKTELMNKMSRGISKIGFGIKKHSPEILIIGGVTGVVVSTVMACKATTKLSGILEDAKEDVNLIHQYMDDPEDLAEEYTAEDGKKDLAITYAQTGLKIAKLYAPSVILGTLSIVAIVSSNNILRKRNIALAAAYTAVSDDFKGYRDRVVERFGKDLDRELKYNIKAREIEEIVVDEDGNETVEKKVVETVNPNEHGIYSYFFDDGCKGWTKDPEANKLYILQLQNYANEKLRAKKYLFLNDILDELGIDRTKRGQCDGWIYDENAVGPQVDFGIFDIYDERKRAFVNGYERTIILDFNCQPNIWDEM